MFDCFYYWVIDPIRRSLFDNPGRSPAFSVNIVHQNGKTYSFAVLCDDVGSPELLRCIIPDVSSEVIPAEDLPILQTLGEHFMSSLRITYKMEATYSSCPRIWNFIKKGQPHSLDVEINSFDNRIFDADKTKSLFILSFEIRELIRLYCDGLDERLPIQYRFLSFYKIIENRFRPLGKWEDVALRELVSPYEKDFKELGLSMGADAALHAFRDKCAHIHTGSKGKEQVLGVTHLNHKEAVTAEKLIPIVRAICAVILNERAAGQFGFSIEVEPTGLMAEREPAEFKELLSPPH